MRLRFLGTAALLCLVAVSCGDGAGPTDEGAEVTSITVALPTDATSFANSDVMVAQEQGFFEEEGIEVEFQNLSSGLDVVQAVVGGSFDIGGASIEPVINAESQGQDLAVFATYADRLTVSMVTPEEIDSADDLEGKALGIQDIGAFREVMTRMVLESAGLSANDVRYRGVETTGYIGSLVSGGIQSAILHAEQTSEILGNNEGFHTLVDLYEVEPDYFYGTYFGTGDWVGENESVAEGFARAVIKAHRFMYDNQEETVRIVAEVTGFDAEVIEDAYQKYFEENNVFPKNDGLDEDRIAYTIERMGELDILGGSPPEPSQIVERGPMEAALTDLGEVEERE